MKIILACLLSFAININAQQPIKITIEKIVTADSIRERVFTVYFSLENTSEKPISFFLEPENLIPAQSGPLASAVFFKIYQENELVDALGILRAPLDLEAIALRRSKFREMSASELEKMQLQHKESFYKNLMTLLPHEKRNYSKALVWNHERYFKQDENEYYLETDKTHYLELLLIFWRGEYETKLLPEHFRAVIEDESFLKGWFVSNKAAIDFSDQ